MQRKIDWPDRPVRRGGNQERRGGNQGRLSLSLATLEALLLVSGKIVVIPLL